MSLSAFFAVVVVCLLLLAGLVIDGGAKVSADRRAEAVAAHAARAGADAAVGHRLVGNDPSSAAHRAALAVLDDAGVAGQVTVTGERVSVTTTITVETTFLSLIGTDTLTGHGRASATSVEG